MHTIMIHVQKRMNKKILLRERKRHTAAVCDYSFCCPILACPPQLDLTPWLDLTPPAGPGPPPAGPDPLAGPDPPLPAGPDPPTSWTWPLAGPDPPCQLDLTPPAGPDPRGWTWPPVWTDRLMEGQTCVKTLPSHRTMYAAVINIIIIVTGYTEVWNISQ